MKLALSSTIKKIDNMAIKTLGISEAELVLRSAEAVARAVRETVARGAAVTVLVGTGNNAADGYAAAALLLNEYSVVVCDVLAALSKPKSPACALMRERYLRSGGRIVAYDCGDDVNEMLVGSDLIVDAVFGTGFSGELPECAAAVASLLSGAPTKVIAVDIPLGVYADSGAVAEKALCADKTVALSYPKTAYYSYPGKDCVGEVIIDRLGLSMPLIEESIAFDFEYVDEELARELLPPRPKNSNKGSFGKLLVIAGSEKYRGAAHLALKGALRFGAGLVSYLGEAALCDELLPALPEVVYSKMPKNASSENGLKAVLEAAARHSAVLVGPGSGNTRELFELVRSLLLSAGAPLVLDADAINAIASDEGRACIKASKRNIILTPHPLEFSRLSGLPIEKILADRICTARAFAAEYGVTLLLKGAGTVITDGKHLYINGSGSSALAKGGSGDVLAGALASLLASGASALSAAALAAYVHGRAGDSLAAQLSSYGVTPSDLPFAMAEVLSHLERTII